jgi:hypothetical protein
MVQITGAVNLTGMIAPTDTTDVYPTHSSEYGKGGYREVANLVERDGIPSPRRVGGMLVTTQDTGKIYRLGSGLTNSDWVEVSMPDTTDISNWNTAHGWGDHGVEGYATETYVSTAISNLIDSAPGTLDTLNELAAALGDDPNFATTITNSIATKVSKSGDTMTGPLVLSGSPTLGSHASTKDYVDSAVNGVSSAVGSLTTDDILEGTSNLYYTDARVDARIPTNISAFSNDVGYITSYVDTNDYVDSATFSTISGNITLGRTGGLSDISVNLDGRYLKIGNAYDSWELRTDNISRGNVDSLEAVNFISGDNITIGYNYNFENEITINAPTQISAFNNDVGYITGYTEVDTLDSVTSRGNVTTNDIRVNNLTVDGNLIVEGTTTTINAQELAIEDNIIYLNEGSTVTNPDLGWSGNYNDGTYRHAGMFRDATDGVFKAFEGYTPEPGQSIDTTHASFSLADLQVENLLVNSSPTLGSHATSKSYVDNAVSSISTTVGNLDTDDVPEGTSNLYYTDARSRASISVSGSLGYNSTTGVISYTQPTNVSAFNNDSGYLTSYTETDPTVPNHVKSITTTEKSNWNTAYSWGDHSTQGYLTSETDSQTLTFNSPNLSISNGNTVDLSALLDDTDTNTYLSSMSFNTTNGVLTATLNDSSTVTVDLDGRYSTTDTTYAQATSTTLGLVKIGYSENGKNYPVELSNGQMFVNVPWTDTNTDTDNYVDSVAFNTTNGILTLGRTGALADLTVDLDGRYSTTDTNTTYSAGDGLQLNGTTFNIKGSEIPGSADLNTYRTTGIYSQNANADAASGLNYPVALAGMLEVINDDKGNGIHTVQRYSQYSSTNVYHRYYYSGTWSSWRNLSQDTNTITNYSAGTGLTLSGTTFAVDSSIATETYVNTQISNLVDTAPTALDTLNELAAALGDDPNFATTVTNSISNKVSKSGDTMSGALVVNTIDSGNPSAATDNIRVSGYGIIGNRGTFYVTNPGTVQIGVGATHNADPAFSFTSTKNTSHKSLDVSGEIVATGDVCAYGTVSDIRQKENVLKLENALEKVNQLNGYTFNYIGKEDRMTGVMAQEVAEVLPEAVFETKAFGAEESTMAVRHGNMVGLLIEAIKDLTEENKYLKNKIEQINKKLNL